MPNKKPPKSAFGSVVGGGDRFGLLEAGGTPEPLGADELERVHQYHAPTAAAAAAK